MRILIVDDSVMYRKLLAETVAAFPELELAGATPNAELALQRLAIKPADLVLLDVNMPGMGGIEALGKIKEQYPKTQVVMISSSTSQSAKNTMQALRMGALEFVHKPAGKDKAENQREFQDRLARILRMLAVPAKTRPVVRDTRPRPLRPAKSSKVPDSFGIMIVGVSTGGPNALAAIIPELPKDFPLPVLVVQHMPEVFTKALAADLDKKSSLAVVEATQDMPLEAGKIIIAQGGHHMVLRARKSRFCVALNDDPPVNSCRPAVDVMFQSVSKLYGKRGVLALVLTGMGTDGTQGMRSLKKQSCYCITQSQDSCVVYGMPRSVDENGLSDESLDLAKIPDRIIQLTKRKGN